MVTLLSQLTCLQKVTHWRPLPDQKLLASRKHIIPGEQAAVKKNVPVAVEWVTRD